MNRITTRRLDVSQTEEAARILRDGRLVAIPTETVYGLAANALDENAVKGIFAAKGRPGDNPLIVHIAHFDMLPLLVTAIPPQAQALAKAFWPGPLTLVLPKSNRVPDVISGGLATVAVRMPAHPVALEIIRRAAIPLAAPSANRSGSPSPTTAAHVLADMDGRIDAVMDGGACRVGLESTVLSLAGDTPVIYRPGAVTPAQLEAVIGTVSVHPSATGPMGETAAAPSPGVRYRHYAPRAQVVLVTGNSEAYARYVNHRAGAGDYGLCFEEDVPFLRVAAYPYGRRDDPASLAVSLFAAFRTLDDRGARIIYAHAPAPEGIGLAVYNRLLRAADFQIVNSEWESTNHK